MNNKEKIVKISLCIVMVLLIISSITVTTILKHQKNILIDNLK